MKKFISTILAAGCITICSGQIARTPAGTPGYGSTPMSNVSDHEFFKDRSKLYFYDEFYVIDGKKVVGSPFLYHDWMNGVITTEDGRVFNNYQLKYNAYQQNIYFLNGADSLEVVDPVKQFTLILQPGDSASVFTFINANHVQKEKKPLYYELLLDNPSYQLLKYNRKRIADATKSLPVAEGRKIFELEVSYYIFNKPTGKLIRIKASGTNIAETLGITPDKIQNVNLGNYDFSVEPDILRFYKMYFTTHTN